ncbi:MAG: hypothetical protein NTX87_10185 [Planctomycetota bacterium]|nr:hypothetical protein [Planctomycetota bacterium]
MRQAIGKSAWVLAALLLAVLCSHRAHGQVMGDIRKIDPPEQGFYSKSLVVRGIRILAHADVSDAAVDEAARRLDRQLARCPEIAANMAALGAGMHIIGKDQQVSDLPEYRHMKGKVFEGSQTVDTRARGLGGLISSCCEENLLMLPSDRWKDHRDICMHEFAHGILSFGLTRDIREKIEAQRKKSLAAGKWQTMYAAVNAQEFFAELTMWYFGTRGDYGKVQPPPAPGPQWLKSYDPEAYALLDAIYSGRLAPGKVAGKDLVPLGAEAEGKIRSQRDQPETTVIFVNKTDKPVEKFWLDFDGKRKSYGAVAPGAVDSIDTFVTHAWLLQDGDGKVLGIFVAEKGVGRIVIEARAD